MSVVATVAGLFWHPANKNNAAKRSGNIFIYTSKLVAVGKGKIDYKSVFQKGKQIGVKWYILEMDKYDGDVYAAVDSSISYIKKEKLLQ